MACTNQPVTLPSPKLLARISTLQFPRCSGLNADISVLVIVAAGRGISCVVEWFMRISELTPVDFEGYGPTDEVQRETEARLKGVCSTLDCTS